MLKRSPDACIQAFGSNISFHNQIFSSDDGAQESAQMLVYKHLGGGAERQYIPLRCSHGCPDGNQEPLLNVGGVFRHKLISKTMKNPKKYKDFVKP